MRVAAEDASLFDAVGDGPPVQRDGSTVAFPDAMTYPPPGFVTVPGFDIGNGDVSGLYWPIGGEDGPPVLCELWHDSWSLEPVATSVFAFLGSVLAETDDLDGDEAEDELFVEHARAAREHLGRPIPPPVEPGPKGLVAMATDAAREGRVDDAEAALRRAIELLPEYGDAHIALAGVLRRQRRPGEALHHDLAAIGCPQCFTSRRTDAVRRVAGAGDDVAPELADDPLFARRRELTFATGVKENADFDRYEEIIAALHSRGEPARAVSLRVLVGELIATETTAFQERRGWTAGGHVRTLTTEIEAHLPARIPAVRATTGPW
jgi:hypothetical protein